MTFLEVCTEYVTSRRSDPALWTCLLGSLTAVVVAAAASPGHRVAEAVSSSSAGGNNLGVYAADSRGEKTGKEQQRHGAMMKAGGRPCCSFYRRLLFLLRVAVPSWRSRESGTLIIISLLLLLRTYLSLRISTTAGHVTRVLIQCNTLSVMKSLAMFLLWCIPAALVNSSVHYCVGMLGLQLHANLGHYFHRKYLNKDVFFPLASESTVGELDQRITVDIDRWSQGVAWMYSSLFKPIIDTALFSYKVASLGGARSTWVVVVYYMGFSAIAYRLSPNLEVVANEELKQEGAFVTAHERLVPYAEELVMTQGQRFHERLMDSHLASILQHKQWASYVRGRYGLLETFFVKHGSALLSYVLCGAAVFARRAEGMSEAELTAVFVEMLLLYKNLALAVGELFKILTKCIVIRALTNRVYALQEGIAEVKAAAVVAGRVASGEVLRSDHIEFDHVPIVLPTGEVLCAELSFYVRPGMNLLVLGPNGCGKSSMVRLLGGLWPLQGGRISKPRDDQIYYVPQRPYISSGTLRDQITYPMRDSSFSVSESTLLTCLEMAMLDDIFSKPNVTWDSFLSWAGDTLSTGEKQKLAMARLFFHRPRFAILDECSSMMDVDVEERLYSVCHHLGISLITIAHRRSVWRHHNWILNFDGCGGFMFSPVTFDGQHGVLLTKIVAASDPSLLGQSVRLDPSQHDE